MLAHAHTLAGAQDRPQHLAEYAAGAVELALAPLAPDAPGENFLLLLGLGTVPAGLGTLDQAWTLPADGLAWLRPGAPVRLRAPAGRTAQVLAWRFTASALPAELAEWLLARPPGPAPLVAPRPRSPTESAFVLGLRSCPVAPALRDFWAAAKLLELVTCLLPAPPARAEPAPDAPAASLPAPVRLALAHMQAHLAAPIGLVDLAAAAGQSPAHFSRVFSEALGHGPTAHLRRLRMEHAARLLAAGEANVTEAAFAAGYQSLGQFSRVFSEHHGRPPSAFLPRGKNR
jgi:AraC-like DNA-binding protein